MNGPLKWHGGKHYLAPRIVEMMPPHTHYVEPFAGGLAVLLAKNPEGVSEVVNDIDGRLMNFWRVLQHPDWFAEFARLCNVTPFSEELWAKSAADIKSGNPAVDAWRFFILCRQSLAGRMSSFAPLSKTRTRRGMNEQASAWLSAVEGLPAVHERLRRVVVLNRHATKVIDSEDGEQTLFYCDPPYLQETRSAPDVYRHEMSEDEHTMLLDLLRGIKGRVMLSGYRSELYDSGLASWRRVDFDLPNNAASGGEKRRMTECLWLNW